MAVRIQLRRDLATNWYNNNPVLRPGEIGIEIDTLKFKIGPNTNPNGTNWRDISAYANVVPSDFNTIIDGYLQDSDLSKTTGSGVAELIDGQLYIPSTSIIFEGTTADNYEITLVSPEPTADRTITLPDATTTLVGHNTTQTLSNKTLTSPVITNPTLTGTYLGDGSIVFEGAVADSYETTVTVTEPTADRTITLPDVTGTVVTTGDTGTVTNTMLSGSIANNKLANSSVTINGYEIALGASASYGTDNISEGTTNKYFTDERAQDAVAAALAAGTHTNITVSYDDNANSISLTGAQTYNDEMARDAIGAALTGGSGITVTPNDNADTITVAVDSSIATKTYADNAVSTGISNLIASAPSALDTLNELAAALGNDANFSTTVTNALAGKQDKVTGVSDTEISYLDGVTSAIQTQLNSKASSTDLSNHENDTTNIHGIADTSALATKTYADNAASSAVSTHEADTTNIHGIADTSALATKTYADNAVSTHEADTTSVHGISDTSKLVTTDDSGTVTSTMIANGTIVNADINASAAIDKTKISGTAITAADTGTVTSTMIADGTIVNGDISSSAAIALSKLATDPLARANHTGTQLASTISDFDTQVRTSKVTDLAAPTGSFSMNSQKIINLATPTADNDAVNKAYVDAAVNNINIHESVVAATTANVNLTNAVDNNKVLDGVTLSTGNRILIKNQNTASQNGVYIVAANGAPTRATDYDLAGEVSAGDFIFVTGGTVNGNTGWIQTAIVATVGTDSITFTQFSGAGTYLAGTGLTLTGTTFAIDSTVATLTGSQTLTNKTLTSPVLTTPTLGTPASGTLTNATGLPLSTGVTGTLPVANGGTGITSLGTGIATFLGTPSSANLASAVTDETGSGALVFGTSPTLSSPTITGTGAIAGTFTGNLTGNVTGNADTVTNGVYTNAANTITAASASTKPLIIKGASSQSANLQEWQNSSGTPLSVINSSGSIIATNTNILGRTFFIQDGGTTSSYSATNYYMGWNNGSIAILPNSAPANIVSFLIKGTSSQTANLQEWQDSNGTVLSRIGNNGTFFWGGNSYLSASLGTALIASNYSSNIPLTVKGASSQSANLQEWQDSSGTVLAKIYSSGAAEFVGGGIALTGGSSLLANGSIIAVSGKMQTGNGVNTPPAQLTTFASNASTISLIARGYASQSADLQQWQNSGGTSIAGVDCLGNAAFGGWAASSSYGLRVKTNGNAAVIGLMIQGASSQTANLQEWQNSSSAVLASIDASGNFSAQDITVAGNLTVNGTTTNLNSTNLVIEDKNIIIADVASPTNITADGAGITVKGTSDKTFNWVAANTAFTSSENMDLASGKTYKINGTDVLSGSALGSGITSSSLTSLGTITSGTWNGTTIAVANGGTGSTTASGARTNLGVVIGTDVQAYNATLAAVAAGTYTGSTSITTLGTITSGTWTGTAIAVANGGTGATSAATARTNLGLAIGTDVQAYNSTLAAVAGGTYTGATSITTLGTIATGTWSATTIATTKGGTGLTSYTTGDILYASATNTLSKLAAGTNGQVLTLSSGVPTWAAAAVTYSAPTIGSTTISSGATVTQIDGLTLGATTTTTVSANTATTVDTTALSGFTTLEYTISLKQGSKVRSSKVLMQTDGTSVDMTEFAITETGGTMSGVVVSATTVSTNGVLQVTVTDAATTNVTVKFTKTKI